jgi:hypothetical protein
MARYREAQKYHAKRGIDSSPFAVPSNFATREKKYEEGLHDLSASLLNHNTQIFVFDQTHNSGQGAHYSFLPLSQEADQEVIFTLTRYAKDRVTFPQLYHKVRGFRAEMTRVKLAQDSDMAVGYSVIPVVKPPTESPGARPAYKLRYGLGNTTTVAGQSPLVTAQIYQARQQTARRFKQILLTRPGLKNEIVIAIRKHAGPFPVYAVRQGKVLKCYDIVDNEMKLNGKTISANGHLT